MKKYRKIKSTNRLPSLPKSFIPIYYLKEKKRIIIWAEDSKKRYTIIWDGISKYPSDIYYNSK
jgi:hypothetical protein